MQGLVIVAYRQTVYGDGARVGQLPVGENAQESALARSVVARQALDVAGFQGQGDLVRAWVAPKRLEMAWQLIDIVKTSLYQVGELLQGQA